MSEIRIFLSESVRSKAEARKKCLVAQTAICTELEKAILPAFSMNLPRLLSV